MPSNAKIKAAAIEALRQRDNAIEVKNDMVRALIAVVNKFGGKVTINEDSVLSIKGNAQVYFTPNRELKEICITTTQDSTAVETENVTQLQLPNV
jgi:Holliday junction resolvase